jgi:hypothetical protein
MAKYAENAAIKGYKGIELIVALSEPNPDQQETETEPETEPLTLRSVLRFVTNVYQAETSKDFRIIAKILDQFEVEDDEGVNYVTMDEAWYKMIEPTLDKVLAVSWKIHSPFIIDQIEDLFKAGKPKAI